MPLSTIITEGLRIIAEFGLPMLSALAGVGIISMALLQVVKDLSRIQANFNRRRIREWLQRRPGADCERQLLMLASGGDADALYELQAPGLMGQIAMASRVAVAYPRQYELLLRALAGPDSDEDISTITNAAREDEQRRQDRLERRSAPDAAAASDVDERRREQVLIDVEQARTRLAHMIERNIDALQIKVSSRWERWNKLWAFVCSWLVTVVAFSLYFYVSNDGLEVSPAAAASLVVTTFAAGIFAGFVAPVAKDLVAALQRLRGAR